MWVVEIDPSEADRIREQASGCLKKSFADWLFWRHSEPNTPNSPPFFAGQVPTSYQKRGDLYAPYALPGCSLSLSLFFFKLQEGLRS